MSIIWAGLFFFVVATYGFTSDALRNIGYESINQVAAVFMITSAYCAVPFSNPTGKTTVAILMAYCWGIALTDWAMPAIPTYGFVGPAFVFVAWLFHARRITGRWLGVGAARNIARRVRDILSREIRP